MEQNSAFINLYIEKILSEVAELTKAKMILATQVAWHERTVQEVTEANSKLQQEVNGLQAKLRTATEKKSKNTAKNSALNDASVASLEDGSF